MKNKIKHLSVAIAVITSLSGVFPHVAHASPASLSISPSSGSIEIGKTLTVNLVVSTNGSPVNAVKAWLSYNPSDFSVSIDNSTSAFEIQAVNSAGSGSVRIERGTTSPKTGTVTVSRLRLTALRPGITSNITYTSDSAVVRSTDQADILSSSSGGTYTLTAPPAPQPEPSPQPSPSPSPTPNPAPSQPSNPGTSPNPNPDPTVEPQEPASTPEKDKTPPDIQNPTIERKDNQLTLSFIATEDVAMELKYGALGNNNIRIINKTLRKNQAFKLDASLLVPGQQYTYVLKATDSSGNTTTKEGEFTVPGANITVRVVDSKGDAIERACVNIGSFATETDDNGLVVFNNLRPGEYTISVSYNGQYQEESVTVSDQDINTEVTLERNNSINALLIVLPIIGVALLAVVASILIRRNSFRPPHLPHMHLPRLPLKNKNAEHSAQPQTPAEVMQKAVTKSTNTGKVYKPTELSENQKTLIKMFSDKTIEDIESTVKLPSKQSYTPRSSRYTPRNIRPTANHAA